MLFNLIVANITILLCFFFLFRVVFNTFFTILVDNENVRLRLALAFPTGVPITDKAIKTIKTLLLIKQLKTYQNNHKEQYICNVFYSLTLFL